MFEDSCGDEWLGQTIECCVESGDGAYRYVGVCLWQAVCNKIRRHPDIDVRLPHVDVRLSDVAVKAHINVSLSDVDVKAKTSTWK